MEHLEIEIKFNVSDFYDLRSRLMDMDATCIGQRTFERNVRYDTEDSRLLEKGCLLRLRKDTDITLTFKSPPGVPETEYKVYRELEVTVNDFDAMDALLKNLGFAPRQIYEKWRETWRLDGEIICMDTMPFGRFLEIEGSPEPIKRLAGKLGLSWEHRILQSYLEMFSVLRKMEGLDFIDVTFDNFRSVRIPFDRYRSRFEADGPTTS